MTEYYLITNISGTSHFGSGSIDKVNDELSETLDIETHCWWRDDLDRRIDGCSDIKWSFPEIIRGSDLLQALLHSTLASSPGRHTAIKAFLAEQYRSDEEVRFKQVELQNKLLDLFIDVPFTTASRFREKRNAFRRPLRSLGEFDPPDADLEVAPYAHTWDSHHRRAAAALLSEAFWTHFPYVVLEGAPGQGKSTITQYICQVHRLRLLNYEHAISQVPEDHRNAEVRVPLRVDLRDYAAWLNGRNPFASQSGSEAHLNPSLETFLAVLVSYHSGGHSFSVSDLAAVASESRLLIVLDGFDEVGDLSTRRRVVEEVAKTAKRLSASSGSLYIIVTSRPAAFANSPGFAEREWTHFELASLTEPDIRAYSERWMKARRLDKRDRASLKQALAEKLDLPHMRELARNPMQLAILLTLIHSRGASLPDKRTALYDKYVELFMSREAEKSSVVKEYQDPIIDLHRYLAWTMHVEAEKKSQVEALPRQG